MGIKTYIKCSLLCNFVGENSHSDILAGTGIISQTGHIFLRAAGQEFVDSKYFLVIILVLPVSRP